MHIGIDFDNTIVNYDSLFHLLAREKKLIPNHLPIDRLMVRNYLRDINQEPAWTALQGEVYGARMNEAETMPHVIAWMVRMKESGHSLSIVSHKTKHPYIGPQYDLHSTASHWIKNHLIYNNKLLFSEDQIFFELTKEEKLARITKINCDVFIDDLPEILLSPQFPNKTKRILFDPTHHYLSEKLFNTHHIQIMTSFTECETYL